MSQYAKSGASSDTTTKKDRIIPLSQQDYSALERALQWPEDLPKYDRIAKPTNLTEIAFAQGPGRKP